MTEQLKDEKGEKFLLRNGVPCSCPFRQPLVLPGKIQGQLSITDVPCSSRCAKFRVMEETSGEFTRTVVLLECGTETSEIYAEEITEEEKNNTNDVKIIKL